MSPVNITNIKQRTDNSEEQLKILMKKIEQLEKMESEKSCQNSTSSASVSVPTNKDNERLKYRINILKNAVAREEKQDVKFVKSILQILRLYFQLAVNKAFPELPDTTPIQVTLATNPKFGDYQCNAAPLLTKALSATGKKFSPRQVADKIVENFPKETGVVEKLDVAGPGFINVLLQPQFVQDEVRNIFINGVQVRPILVKKKVVVDFSSPNVAKEMHVGHLRSTIIGDSTCRLLEYLGYDVLRLNHIGDWGTQFGMLIAHLQDTFPDYMQQNKHLPVSDLQEFYKASKKRFDEDEEFKKRAYACVVDLQARKPEFIKAWNMICDVSRKEFSKVYERLNVKLIERGESFYQERMEKIVKEFAEKGFLEDDLGEGDSALKGVRKVMHSNLKSPVPLIMVKSDGGFTYDTSDMATIRNRIEEEKADWIIYITDAGQASHFQLIFNCAEIAGILDPTKVRVDHVGFGVVLGEDKKKFKTRSGDVVKLVDLLDEGLKRAGDKLKEKGRDKELTEAEFTAAQTSVAYGCIKYADLSHNRNHEYVFSFDKMLDDKGNTAVYLLYAYTRIKAIARNAGVSEEKLKGYVANEKFTLTHEKELKLAKKILRFPEVIERITDDLALHPLCELLYDIAVSFSEFYDSCYCIEKDEQGAIKTIHMHRLVLCEATANVLKQGFDILGLYPVQKM